MTDYKQSIIQNLTILYNDEKSKNNFFKARAYEKVIKGLKIHQGEINTIDDFKKIDGVGKSITTKVEQLINDGIITNVEKIKEKDDNTHEIFNELLKIHGIGHQKAKELINTHNIKSIEDLKKNTSLLNDVQKLGLKYYEDFIQKIPRAEFDQHVVVVKNILNEKFNRTKIDFVGSYRRNNESMSDIDLLVKANKRFDMIIFVNLLKENGYIIDTLALGSSKFMGVSKINDLPARRIDILLMDPVRYNFALLYFTGPQLFNIELRKLANKKGYSLNEYGLKDMKTNEYIDKEFKSEKEIFNFLGMEYITPKKRNTYF